MGLHPVLWRLELFLGEAFSWSLVSTPLIGPAGCPDWVWGGNDREIKALVRLSLTVEALLLGLESKDFFFFLFLSIYTERFRVPGCLWICIWVNRMKEKKLSTILMVFCVRSISPVSGFPFPSHSP